MAIAMVASLQSDLPNICDIFSFAMFGMASEMDVMTYFVEKYIAYSGFANERNPQP